MPSATNIFPDVTSGIISLAGKVKLLLASKTVALLAGKQQKTNLVPAEKSTALSLFELDITVVLASVELSEDKVPKPTSNSAFNTIQ